MLDRLSETSGAVRPLADLRGIEPVPASQDVDRRPTANEEGTAGSLDSRGQRGDSAELSRRGIDRAAHDADGERADTGTQQAERGDVRSDGAHRSHGTREDRPAAPREAHEAEHGTGSGSARELTDEERREVAELRARDAEVRAHEQAHAGAGGHLAGAPSYDTRRGPDGREYAVGGEVPLELRQGETPEETIRNMEQARRAALAPAQPSPQDRRVAAEASRLAAKARAEQQREALNGEESEAARRPDERAGTSSTDEARAQRPASAEPAERPEFEPLDALPFGDDEEEGVRAPYDSVPELVKKAIDTYMTSGRDRRGDGSVSLLA